MEDKYEVIENAGQRAIDGKEGERARNRVIPCPTENLEIR